FFGDRLMSSFTIEDIERLLGGMKQLPGLKGDHPSAARPNKGRALLSRILDRAVKKGWLTSNPCQEVARLREDPATIDPLSWWEVQIFLGKGFTDPAMRRFYITALFSGLRTSELLGLKWTDLDFVSQPPQAHIKGS